MAQASRRGRRKKDWPADPLPVEEFIHGMQALNKDKQRETTLRHMLWAMWFVLISLIVFVGLQATGKILLPMEIFKILCVVLISAGGIVGVIRWLIARK